MNAKATGDTFRQDLKFALRTLGRSPAFTAAAVLTLTLGIGANTAVFSVVDGILLRPLPYAAPDRLVAVNNRWEGESRGALSAEEFFDYREHVGTFEAIGAYGYTTMNLIGGSQPERVRAAAVSAGVLPLLGVDPPLGRVFTVEEDRPGSGVVVLSDGLWRRRFGGSPDVIGREIIANGRTRQVVGVMPAGFQLPEDFVAGEATELYVPLGIERGMIPNRSSHFLRAVARLEPGLEPARATEQLRTLAASFMEAFPDDYSAGSGFSATAVLLAEDVLGPLRPALLVLLGAVAFVLLIACGNLSNLLLARVETRQREFAVRAALGAGRGRLARQVLTESVLLGLGGGVLGILVANVGTRLFVALAPADFPRLDAVTVDLRMLAFAFGVSLVTGLGVGLVAVLQVSYDRTHDVLREERRGATVSRRGHGLRRALVVAELAFALVLLVGAGLLVRSFARLMAVDPGYRTENILAVHLSLPAAEYESDERVRAFYSEVRRRVGALPGVRASGAVAHLPLASEAGDLGFRIEGRPELEGGERSPNADWQVVTPGYLSALGIAIVRGRGITERDDTRSPGVVVIDQVMAERYWARRRPDRPADPARRRRRTGSRNDRRHRARCAAGKSRCRAPTHHVPSAPAVPLLGRWSGRARHDRRPAKRRGAGRLHIGCSPRDPRARSESAARRSPHNGTGRWHLDGALAPAYLARDGLLHTRTTARCRRHLWPRRLCRRPAYARDRHTDGARRPPQGWCGAGHSPVDRARRSRDRGRRRMRTRTHAISGEPAL